MAALDGPIAPHLRALPDALRVVVERLWAEFPATSPDGAAAPRWLDALPRVWACSDFVARACLRDPPMLRDLVSGGELFRRREPGELLRSITDALADVADEDDLMRRLRQVRRREMVRIAWRDLAGWADLDEVMDDLSDLAEGCIDGALAHLDGWQRRELGTPVNSAGKVQGLVVLGMGKLGARELNFSSDVDLIFAYPDSGETRDGPRSLSNEEYFNRLGRRLINVLNQTTADGFVFRVDMRLRPFGNSGRLAISFDATEHYYQSHGREWERYALIKVRVVAGDREAGRRLSVMLRPFVYRRYLDYGAFESLREMKRLIASEVKRKEMVDDIKLGAGGIREIEFIGQAFQLIRGGREPRLRERQILGVLTYLGEQQYLPEHAVRALTAAYVFLRRVEHRLQAYADQQTHTLPRDDLGRLRLAFSMGYADWAQFATALRAHRHTVQGEFERVFEAPQRRHAENDGFDLRGAWLGRGEDGAAVQALRAVGFDDPAEALRQLRALREGRVYASLGARGHERMDRLMPLVIGAAGQAPDSTRTLARLLAVLERIAGRTAYLALLVENPMALSQLVQLCAASPWIAHYVGQHPLLLDELLDPRTLYTAPDKAALVEELRTRLQQIDAGDLEQAMETLRNFKQANVLRVAAADISGSMPLMVVSDHLTWIAETVLAEVLDLAWDYVVSRHGRPICTAGGDVCDKGFAVVAYGKLGGIELGYGSDLDVVFLHSGEADTLETTGKRPVTLQEFFSRLARRMIHLLTTLTPAGTLYEVDMRLRPNGASGMMVSSLAAFEEYQRRSAWTWEHQALVRARVVAGDPAIALRFEAIRRDVLGQRRDPDTLRREVREMRDKMRLANRAAAAGQFDLKQDRGGIADIEFMVQYGILAWSSDHPALLTYTDNIRLLAGFADAGLLSTGDVQLLSDAYRAYRARVHRLTLQEQPAVVPETEFSEERETVTRLWQALMEPSE